MVIAVDHVLSPLRNVVESFTPFATKSPVNVTVPVCMPSGVKFTKALVVFVASNDATPPLPPPVPNASMSSIDVLLVILSVLSIISTSSASTACAFSGYV